MLDNTTKLEILRQLVFLTQTYVTHGFRTEAAETRKRALDLIDEMQG